MSSPLLKTNLNVVEYQINKNKPLTKMLSLIAGNMIGCFSPPTLSSASAMILSTSVSMVEDGTGTGLGGTDKSALISATKAYRSK